MMLFENIRIALVELWANRLRSFLAMLGIFIATAATISVVSIVLGFNQYIGSIFLGLKDTLYVVSESPGASSKEISRYTPLRVALLESLPRMVPEIAKWSFVAGRRITVKHLGTSSGGWIGGATEHGMQIYGARVTRGRPFNEQTFSAVPAPCWVSENAAERLNFSGDALGQILEIDGVRFTIVGITDMFSKQEPQDSSVRMLTSYATFCRIYGAPDSHEGELLISKAPGVAMSEAKRSLTSALRRLHGLSTGDANDFRIHTIEGEQESFSSFIAVSGSILFGIVGISLLVGGIGIMNIMLVSVRERTREIGIRMAVGARRRDILMQFITESVTLCCIGGALGVLFGYALGLAIARLIGVVEPLFGTVYFSPLLVGGSLAFSAAVGIFFGVLPARDASKMDPIEALRFE